MNSKVVFYYPSILLFFLTCLNNPIYSQEIHLHENGLIYKPATMNRLSFIADSLNVNFKKCEIRKQWNSVEQGVGCSYWTNDSIEIIHAIEKLKKGVSRKEMEKFLDYPKKESKNALILRMSTYDGEEKKFFKTYATTDRNYIYDEVFTADSTEIHYSKSKNGGDWFWVKEYSEDRKKVSLNICYLEKHFEMFSIPSKYNEWINYSQCMVDTTTDVYLPDAKYLSIWWGSSDDCGEDSTLAQRKFIAFIDSIKFDEEEPVEPEYYGGKNDTLKREYYRQYGEYNSKFREWEERKEKFILSVITGNKEVYQLADLAWKEAVEMDCHESKTAYYIATYFDKSKGLDLRRSRIPVGFCSRDESPRVYLSEIAILAADAGRWEVFLRSHLDLINDRVARNSDNSIAYKYRGVYIKELEQLPINLEQLFPGMIFRINNPPIYHYYNTITRSARAMAVSSKPLEYYELMLSIASDRKLDMFNRLIYAYVVRGMYYHMDQQMQKKVSIRDPQKALKDLPGFVQNLLKRED